MRNRLTLGAVLCVLFITTTVSAQVEGNWANTTGSMAWVAKLSTQVRLNSGKVLVAGGTDGTGTNYFATAQLYNPATGTWKATTGSMSVGRAQFAAVVLPGGKVLVEGGTDGPSIWASAELYDPSTDKWSSAGSMHYARYGHTATLLPNGKVLVTGGCVAPYSYSSYSCSTTTNVSEIFDPSTGAWNTTTSMNTTRGFHTATLLNSGKVLVVGGYNPVNGQLKSSELFDPLANAWTQGPDSSVVRVGHTATLLSNGRVLVAGGEYAPTEAEVYDPTVPPHGGFSATTSLNKPGRFAHTATALPNNTVLLAAGEYIQPCGLRGRCPTPLSTAEIYDYNLSPPTVSLATGGVLNTARAFHTATLLTSNDVLVAGGCTGRYCPNLIAASEIYTPLTLSISPYSWSFGLEEKGVTSPAKTINVSNVSHGPVKFGGIAASGDYHQTNNCPTNLLSGDNCAITVTFKPTATGTRTGVVTLHDNSVGSPSQSIALTGTGEQYAISFTPPSSLTLPSVIPSGTTQATATVTNDGPAAVTISSIAINPINAPDGTFTVPSSSTNCLSMLQVQRTCTITVNFTPPDSITFTAWLQVFDNAPGSPHQLLLTGTGID